MCNKAIAQSIIGQLAALKSRLPMEQPVIDRSIAYLRNGYLFKAIDCIEALLDVDMPAITRRSVVALHVQLASVFEDGD